MSWYKKALHIQEFAPRSKRTEPDFDAQRDERHKVPDFYPNIDGHDDEKALKQTSLEEHIKKEFSEIVPKEVVEAIYRARQEHDDSSCQAYIDAIGKAMVQARHVGVSLEKAVKIQCLYIYSNMEDYPNEFVKNIIADFADIPQEHRHKRYENPEFHSPDEAPNNFDEDSL